MVFALQVHADLCAALMHALVVRLGETSPVIRDKLSNLAYNKLGIGAFAAIHRPVGSLGRLFLCL